MLTDFCRLASQKCASKREENSGREVLRRNITEINGGNAARIIGLVLVLGVFVIFFN